MHRSISDSTSIILRSTHIGLLRIIRAEPQPWENQPGDLRRRAVQLKAQWLETLKGTVSDQSPKPFDATVMQYKTAGPFILPTPGAWSYQDLQPGLEVIIFSRTNQDSIQAVLADGACELVQPAQTVLTGVRLAMDAIKKGMEIDALLPAARANAADLDEIFCSFFGEYYKDSILDSLQDYDQYLSFLQTPALTPTARSVVLDAVYSAASDIDDDSERVCRLAAVMFKLVALPEANALHDNIIQVFLPNLIGLSGGARKRSADEVFSRSPEERLSARQTLLRYAGTADPSQLLHWLE